MAFPNDSYDDDNNNDNDNDSYDDDTIEIFVTKT